MDEVFRIKKDKIRAKSIFLLAKDRFEFIEFYPKEKVYKIIEESYESIKELLTSLMYFEGYKTLSHIKLLEFANSKFDLFSPSEYKLIENLRKFRNGTMYYGQNISSSFLDNHLSSIEKVILKLIRFVEDKLSEAENEF